MALKCYSIDWKYLHWQVKYTPDQAQKISNKLARHFKIRLSGIRFANYSRGLAYYSGYIKFPKKDISLGMVCHEIGHLLSYKYGYRGHNKRAYKYIRRVYNYGVKYIPTEILLALNYRQKLLTYK